MREPRSLCYTCFRWFDRNAIWPRQHETTIGGMLKLPKKSGCMNPTPSGFTLSSTRVVAIVALTVALIVVSYSASLATPQRTNRTPAGEPERKDDSKVPDAKAL